MTVQWWQQETIHFMFNKQHFRVKCRIGGNLFIKTPSLDSYSKCTIKEPRTLHERIFCVNLKKEYFLCKILLNLQAVLFSCNCLVLKDKVTLETYCWGHSSETENARVATDTNLLLTWLHKLLVRNKAGKGSCLKELVVRTKKRKTLEHSTATDNTRMWLWSGEWNAGPV